MNDHKNLLHHIADWWQSRQERPHTANWSRWLPTPGNILFTLLMIGLLIFTQQTWANNGPESVNVPGPSATTINYQGRLADSNGAPINGNRTIQFAIYDAASGGNVVWGAETHANVPVTDGLFNVGLGSVNSGGIPTTVWNGDRYLQITVGGETLSPRELIRSVPVAGMALTVPDGAISTAQLADGSVTKSKLVSNVMPSTISGVTAGQVIINSGQIVTLFSQTFQNIPAGNVFLSARWAGGLTSGSAAGGVELWVNQTRIASHLLHGWQLGVLETSNMSGIYEDFSGGTLTIELKGISEAGSGIFSIGSNNGDPRLARHIVGIVGLD